MLIQIDGKQHVDASSHTIVIQFNQEEKQGISNSNPSDDLFAYFPKGTKTDAVDYHVKKMNDYIDANNKSPVDEKIQALSDDNEKLRQELEDLKNGIVKPTPMLDDGDVPAIDVKEIIQPDVVVPEDVN